MKVIACVLTLFLGLSVVSSVTAAEVLTLDDCIELALQNRASIIAARGHETLAGATKRAALGAFLPRIDASYGYSKTYRRDIKSDEFYSEYEYVKDSIAVYDPEDSSTSYLPIASPVITDVGIREIQIPDQNLTNKSLRFSAGMSVFNLSNWFNLAGAKADKAKAHLDVIGSEQDLIKAVKVSYYYYLAAVENVNVQEQAVKRSKEQLKLINSKYELGSASLSDVLKQKVQFGNDRLALLTAENNVTSGRANLAYTVGLNPNSDYEFSTEYKVREYSGTLKQAMSYGLKRKPSLLSAQESVDAARYALRSRKASYLPTLSASASLSFSDGTQGDTLTYNSSSRSATIGFNISLPIFDGFQREYNLTQAKVNLNNARAGLSDERNFACQKIKTAYFDIERLKEKKKVSKENVDAANQDLKITQEKYNLGAATILDLLDAQVSLKQAQVSLIQADFDLNLAIAKLENAMGKM
ncbi:MAG: TolC family protein [candidate division Zixibacteria bacterium]|nr:TolC family protein [candidate division Zixibacteria bacterium]